MKAKTMVKRIVALGTGLSMVGATLFGAAAADLSEYPNPLFIRDGVFDGIIVVGDDAAASDVIGSIDIATALQAEAVETQEVDTGGRGLVAKGDAVEFSDASDLLEVGENLGDVRETYTEEDLQALTGVLLTTDEGTTPVHQYLRFEEVGTHSFNSSLRVVYNDDEFDQVGDFLFSDRGEVMFEYELEFDEGAESRVNSATGDLDDLEDEIFNILGVPFAVSDTDVTIVGGVAAGAEIITIELLGGAIHDIMEEGETKTYEIEGKTYEVNVLIVSDNNDIVKFKINGEITDELEDGETEVLKDGTRIGVREILPNEAEEITGGDLVEFYLGANEIEWEDGNFSDGNFTQGTEINDENIEDSTVNIVGARFSGGRKFEINSIKYRLEADTPEGDIYVSPGKGIREYLDEPEGMLVPSWDIRYEGLMDTGVSLLKFDASGDDEYKLKFENRAGFVYNIDLLSYERTAGASKHGNTGLVFGDDDDNLVFREIGNNTNSSVYNIAEDDFFVVTDDSDETGFTHVFEYAAIDTSDKELTFNDLGAGTKEVSYEGTEGRFGTRGDLIASGNTFKVFVGPIDNDGRVNITVDLDNSGVLVNMTQVPIVVKGGGLLVMDSCDLAFTVRGTGAGVGLKPGPGTVCPHVEAGQGRASIAALGLGATTDILNMTLVTLDSEFDERGVMGNGGDEEINISFDVRAGNELGVDIDDITFRGENSNTPYTFTLQELDENDDIERGITPYGVLVERFDENGDDAEDITIEYPLQQRGTHVFIVAGASQISKTGGLVLTQTVNKIAVGAAKLASEVEDITAVNAIVVGGPCANAAAATLMANPADCAAGFEPGKAMIKLFEHGSKAALLVAGYSALDTRRAARVLANYQDYDLSGKELVVTGTSLTDITVRKATA